MFKDKYSAEMDNIRPDGYIKQKVLKSIAPKNNKKPSKTLIFRSAMAVAACICLIVSVFTIKTVAPQMPAVKKVMTYDSVYKTVAQYKTNDIIKFFSSATDFLTEGDKETIVEEYEYVTDDSAVNNAKPNASDGSSNKTETSATNEQVEGVGEADIIKTDGKYIYAYSNKMNKISVISAGKDAKKVGEIKLEQNEGYNTQMYLKDSRLAVVFTAFEDNKYNAHKTTAYLYDVADPQNPKKLYECVQSGYYRDSRLIGDKLYLISDYSVDTYNIKRSDVTTYVPSIECADFFGAVAADSISINEVCRGPEYNVICSYDIDDGTLVSTHSLLGGVYTLYCSQNNIITAGYSEDGNTAVNRYSIDDGKITLAAQGSIKGDLLNQFSIDEYNGYFRFVTTVNNGKETRESGSVRYEIMTSNSLVVLNGDLKQVGAVENLAPDERVYSVRFMGDTAFFVTFRQVDPLFSVDLSEPEKPKVIGALKIPGFSNYLFPYGEGKLLGIGQEADEYTGGTLGLKLSMFDISDPAAVTEYAKTVLKEKYSEALANHKASLVDVKRNLIGFSVWGDYGQEYVLYSLESNGFNKVASFKISGEYDLRGLYINDEFYVIGQTEAAVYSMNDYRLIKNISLE